MANAEHLKIIKQGVSVWNDWRDVNPDVFPDLSAADLIRADLSEVNLREANLNGAKLIRADLTGADLTGADLTGAKLIVAYLNGADLMGAKLIRAHLSDADLSSTDLRDADLSDADLRGADLNRAYLNGANFSAAVLVEAYFSNSILFKTKFNRSRFGYTTIANCDVRKALGLDMVRHIGPSSIGIDTLFKSGGNIPLSFLEGCGIDPEISKCLLNEARTKMHYSCFIAHSSKDGKFAKKLKKNLESNNIKCWFFPEDATWGRDTYENIGLAIKAHDKLIIICSKNSLNSEPVLREIEHAIQEEKTRKEKHKQTERVLFPITIDNYFFDEWEHYLKADFLKITIGDFRKWKDSEEYEKSLHRLVKALQKK